jgi:hypothetical protein
MAWIGENLQAQVSFRAELQSFHGEYAMAKRNDIKWGQIIITNENRMSGLIRICYKRR